MKPEVVTGKAIDVVTAVAHVNALVTELQLLFRVRSVRITSILVIFFSGVFFWFMGEQSDLNSLVITEPEAVALQLRATGLIGFYAISLGLTLVVTEILSGDPLLWLQMSTAEGRRLLLLRKLIGAWIWSLSTFVTIQLLTLLIGWVWKCPVPEMKDQLLLMFAFGIEILFPITLVMLANCAAIFMGRQDKGGIAVLIPLYVLAAIPYIIIEAVNYRIVSGNMKSLSTVNHVMRLNSSILPKVHEQLPQASSWLGEAAFFVLSSFVMFTVSVLAFMRSDIS